MHIERSRELEENENQLVFFFPLLVENSFSNTSHSKFILCFQIFLFVLARITSVTYYNNVIYIFWLGMRFVIIYKVSISNFRLTILNFKSFSVFTPQRYSLVFYKHIFIYLVNDSLVPSTSPQICIFSVFSFSYYLFFFSSSYFAKRKYYTFFKLFYDDFMNNKDLNLLSIIYGCKEFCFFFYMKIDVCEKYICGNKIIDPWRFYTRVHLNSIFGFCHRNSSK